jgi:hypothetical protein
MHRVDRATAIGAGCGAPMPAPAGELQLLRRRRPPRWATAAARWYTTKTEPSYDDMAIKLRRVIIAARFRSPCPEQVTPQETRAVLAAWAAGGT